MESKLVISLSLHGGGTREIRSNLGDVDVVVCATRIASLMLSDEPPVAWSASVDGVDVTHKLRHVVRATVSGGTGPEARFFLDTLWGEP